MPLVQLIMEEAHVAALLEQLDGSIDHLDDVLAPLLKAALSETAAKLPLLDKAKLSVMMTYAIESCLFCESSQAQAHCL